MSSHGAGIIIAGLMLVPIVSLAEDYQIGDEPPSKEKLIEMLKPRAGEEPAGRARGLRVQPKTPSTQEAAVSMNIKFAYNSAILTPDAQHQLSTVGEALASDELANLRFVVEGHTDSKGSARYNQVLSERRAAAVKHFLAQHYQIGESRIIAVGKGESAPLAPEDPASSANRRVRIVARQ
jgi:outer membrane protein OmpA-like peptidoglycan-associated protein